MLYIVLDRGMVLKIGVLIPNNLTESL